MGHKDYQLRLSQAAISAIRLMKDNDYTLENQHMRISIKGKGCDGFTYQLGFSAPQPEDIVCTFKQTNSSPIYILLDRFAAFYVRQGLVDYKQLDNGEEGFYFENDHQNLYHGKFYKDTQLAPKIL